MGIINPFDASRQSDIKDADQFYVKTKIVDGREVKVLKYGKPSILQSCRAALGKGSYEYMSLNDIFKKHKVEDLRLNDLSLRKLPPGLQEKMTNIFTQMNGLAMAKEKLSRSMNAENLDIPQLLKAIKEAGSNEIYISRDEMKVLVNKMNADQKTDFFKGLIHDEVNYTNAPLRVSSTSNYIGINLALTENWKEIYKDESFVKLMASIPGKNNDIGLTYADGSGKEIPDAEGKKTVREKTTQIFDQFVAFSKNIPKDQKSVYQEYYRQAETKYGSAKAKQLIQGAILTYIIGKSVTDNTDTKTLAHRFITGEIRGAEKPNSPYQQQLNEIMQNLGIPVEVKPK